MKQKMRNHKCPHIKYEPVGYESTRTGTIHILRCTECGKVRKED
jgi:hypothetical protein